MRRLAVDFIKPAQPWAAGWALLALSLVLLAVMQWHAMQLQKAAATLTNASHPAASKPKSPPLSAEALDVMRKQYAAAGELAAFLQLPWRDLFAALEIAASDDVALLAIEPDHKKRTVRITAEATDYAAIVEYLKRLGDAPQLEQVYLQRYQQAEEGNRAWRFTVEAKWRLGA